MEGVSAKVLDSGRRLVVDMKKKRSARCMTHFTGATCSDVRDLPSEVYRKQIASHTDSYVYKNSSGPSSKSSLIRNYLNFMKSGPPQRVLYYENEEWIDFSEGLVILIKKDFQMKKAAVEVEFMGSPSLLDFLHMILVDLQTGSHQPIAWIDEMGSCFFPKTYSENEELHEWSHSGGKENHPLLYSEPNSTHEIKLQLEIEVTADGMLKMGDCTEGLNSHVKRLKVEGNPVNDAQLDQEASTEVKAVDETNEVIGENNPLELVLPNTPTLGASDEKLNSETVQLMFIKGMGPSVSTSILNGIQRISGRRSEARLELFEKQVEITKKYRGNANLRYAWLGSSKAAASRILIHGLGINELPKTDPTYGIGVHLTSLDHSHTSASYCDVDENGVQHMVLCRVILGNMELVHPGSKQCFPSCEIYDSGVNDFLNPEHYIVWNMNMATHIYPEFVVSFRSPSAKGESFSRKEVSAVTYSSGCQEKLQAMSSPVDSYPRGTSNYPAQRSVCQVGICHRTPDVVETSQGNNSTIKFAGRPPKSLWMPFPALFGAIEDKVPYSKMKKVYQYHDLFLSKKISRDELVQRMRSTVGDALLRSTIISLRAKYGKELKVPKHEQVTSASP